MTTIEFPGERFTEKNQMVFRPGAGVCAWARAAHPVPQGAD